MIRNQTITKVKLLKDVISFQNGKGHEKNIVSSGKYTVVNAKFISTDGKVKKFSNEQILPLFIDDILIVMSDLPNGKALSKTFFIEQDDKFTLNQRIGRITVKNKNELLPKFVYFFLNRTKQLTKYNNGVDQTNLKKEQILNVQIPIPSLKIQSEIVRILDSFTALTTELTTELNARKKQYNYYRDQLLTFSDDEVEWKTLGEIANVIDSLHQTPKYVSVSDFNMIRVTDINGGLLNLENALKVDKDVFNIFTKKYVPQHLDLVMSRVGSYGKVSIVPKSAKICIGQNTVVINSMINPMYLYYILISINTQIFIEKNVGGGNQKTLSLKSIKSIPIPIPSLKKQAEIVEILDKFDTLTTSITEGLPREIELRKKQYEYYRDLLLTFPKPDNK